MSTLRRLIALLAALVLSLQGFAAAQACPHGFVVPQGVQHATDHEGHAGHAHHHHPAPGEADAHSEASANSGDTHGAGACALCAHCAGCFSGLAPLGASTLALDAGTDYGLFSPAATSLFDPEQPRPPPLA